MDEKNESISKYYFESITTKLERTIERLWILAIILVVLLVGSNAAWMFYENQFEDTVITQDVKQDSGEGGMNTYKGNVVGGDYSGETDDTDNDSETNP